MLSPRTGTILKSIITQYIARAVPVPSQSVAGEPELGVSPATIRNEMAYLEQAGYIVRPHTSAGSVPSDKGYRYYVTSLAETALPPDEQRMISHLFHQVEGEMEKWLSLAATVTAHLVKDVAVVTMPKQVNHQFKYLELVALQGSRVLVVLVLEGARVRRQLITFDPAVSQPELTIIGNKLNATYAGLTRRQISTRRLKLTPTEQKVNEQILKMMQAEDEELEPPYLDGLHFMLDQPEFAHSRQMLTLMELVEHRNLLRAITPQDLHSRKVQVVIGKENKADILHNYSVVMSQYGLQDEAEGTVYVIGPTRMPYAHAIPVVGYLSLVLSRLVASLYGRETSGEPA